LLLRTQPPSRDAWSTGDRQPVAFELPIDGGAWHLSGDTSTDGRIGEEWDKPDKEEGKRRYAQRACDASEQLGHRIAPQR
jgi:hypothetical protein